MSTTLTDQQATQTPIPDVLISKLESWDRPLYVGHVRPDADCLGSLFAMALCWPGRGKTGLVSLPDGSVSRRLAFLVDWAAVPTATADDFSAADGFVAVDTAKKPRCNVPDSVGKEWETDREIINIDHHASNTRFGAVDWIDARAGSSAELVYRLIRAADKPITPLIASMLYAGIHSDTVGFSLQSTAASALHAAADLVVCGARVAEIGEHLTRSQSRSEFELNRVIYENTRIVADGRVAYSTTTYDELIATSCCAADIDDQVNIPRSIEGVKVAFLLTEGTRGKTRLNLRGESGFDVLSIAQQLGGGGHTEAAGAILNGPPHEAIDRVLPLITRKLDERTTSQAGKQ